MAQRTFCDCCNKEAIIRRTEVCVMSIYQASTTPHSTSKHMKLCQECDRKYYEIESKHCVEIARAWEEFVNQFKK